MRLTDSLTLSLAIMRKSAGNDFMNVGGINDYLSNPWLSKIVNPAKDFMQRTNPMLQHAQTIMGSGSQAAMAPKLPAPPPMASAGPSVASRLPVPGVFGTGGGMEGAEGAVGTSPSLMPKFGAMVMAPKLPMAMPKQMTVTAPNSAMSGLTKDFGRKGPVPGLSSNRFGPKWFMGGSTGSGGTAGPSGPTFTGPAGGSTAGPGSSAGTTGGGDSGAAGMA